MIRVDMNAAVSVRSFNDVDDDDDEREKIAIGRSSLVWSDDDDDDGDDDDGEDDTESTSGDFVLRSSRVNRENESIGWMPVEYYFMRRSDAFKFRHTHEHTLVLFAWFDRWVERGTIGYFFSSSSSSFVLPLAPVGRCPASMRVYDIPHSSVFFFSPLSLSPPLTQFV